jgi:hypothetical protein
MDSTMMILDIFSNMYGRKATSIVDKDNYKLLKDNLNDKNLENKYNNTYIDKKTPFKKDLNIG